MAATKEDIVRWFDTGKEKKATHLIVVCDTYDWDDYPVYVEKGQDVYEVAAKYQGKNMQKIMEVYNLSMDKEKQMKEDRTFNE